MYARLLLIYAWRRASGGVDFVCPPAGLRTHADRQYVPRHAPEYPGWDRGIFARSNWRGRFRFLGRYRHRIAPLREVDPKIGHIRAFLALGAIASTAPLVHLLAIHPISWVAARALTGFCFAGLFMVVESWLNGAATEQTRGQILSVYGMTGLLAGILGQLLLPTANPAGFRPFCVIAIIIAIALVPIALTQAVAPTRQGGEIRISLRELYRQSPFGLVAAFLCGVTTSAFFTLGPIFAQRRGLDTAGVAIFMASGTLGGFLLTYPLGLLSDRVIEPALPVATTLRSEHSAGGSFEKAPE